MSYEKEIELVENTFGKDVNLQAQDKDGNAVDLTGCTVKWVVYKFGATSAVLIVTCTAVDLANGKVKYSLQSGDWGSGKLEAPQEYKSSLVATKTGYQEEFQDLTVKTLEAAPSS